MPNRLAAETSPYLLQHKDNPVDWYPWGDEAFEVARDLDRPILLSVGYSTCHWCHVMERESFENDETAAVMNAHFVSIKVDREERPDVDAVYMDAVNAMTGRGGWPMTVFLTPAGEPFFAGTYFPPTERHGMPSFRRVLAAMHDAWTNRRSDLVDQAAQLTAGIGRLPPIADDLPGGTALVAAIHTLRHQFDEQHGGFGGAPKFPQAPVLEFLARAGDEPWADSALPMLNTTLEAMADGGIRDHLGGGFSRYAVDRTWLVPHFEKMLYDNADLARLYTQAWQITGNDRFRHVAYQTLDYILDDLTHPRDGFYAAEDADSEGVEGKFYVFTAAEFEASVDEDARVLAANHFGVTATGNFEGSNVLHVARPVEALATESNIMPAEAEAMIGRARTQLLAARASRIRPGLDDKVITEWNGLALRALAVAGSVFDESRFLTAAIANARFVLEQMATSEGRLLRSWSPKGAGKVTGFLADHAAYALGLLALFRATGTSRWFTEARRLVDLLDTDFVGDGGVIYSTATAFSDLVVRPVDQQDNPSPSGASLAAEAYHTMFALTGDAAYADRRDEIIKAGAALMERAPAAVGHLLAVHATARKPNRQVAILGPEAAAWARRLDVAYRPGLVVAHSDVPSDDIPLLAGRFVDDGQTRAYVCEQMVCQIPVTSYEAMIASL